MYKFSESRAPLIEPFIKYRISSNNWNKVYESNLLYFDRYCSNHFPDIPGVTQEMIQGWCTKRDTETKNSFINRTASAIRFVEYLIARELTDIIVPEMPQFKHKHPLPYSFTEEELTCFFKKADSLVKSGKTSFQRFISLGISVTFRLLYSSGMRTTEVRLLLAEQVDLKNGIIDIRETKGNQQHYVALHEDSTEMLINYNKVAELYYPKRKMFLVLNAKDPNKPISSHMLDYHFHKIWDDVNNPGAVPYDFRHNYAIENINSWIDIGFEFHNKLVALSKSMGHTSLESTKYYYSIVPTLANVLEKKTMAGFDDIVPEVPNYEEI